MIQSKQQEHTKQLKTILRYSFIERVDYLEINFRLPVKPIIKMIIGTIKNIKECMRIRTICRVSRGFITLKFISIL
jgi:hypothetical protein